MIMYFIGDTLSRKMLFEGIIYILHLYISLKALYIINGSLVK